MRVFSTEEQTKDKRIALEVTIMVYVDLHARLSGIDNTAGKLLWVMVGEFKGERGPLVTRSRAGIESNGRPDDAIC